MGSACAGIKKKMNSSEINLKQMSESQAQAKANMREGLYTFEHAQSNQFMAIQNGRPIMINRDQFNGSQIIRIEGAGYCVYFLSSDQSGGEVVLAIDDSGVVTTTPNRAYEGWEGLKFEQFGRAHDSLFCFGRAKDNQRVLAYNPVTKQIGTTVKSRDGTNGEVWKITYVGQLI